MRVELSRATVLPGRSDEAEPQVVFLPEPVRAAIEAWALRD